MGRNKFFYNRVYNVKRNIINAIIIGVCIIGIIICFIVVSNFQKRKDKEQPEGILNIKSEVTVEINDSISKDLFFSKIENIKLDEIEITYPVENITSKVGNYEVIIKVSGKNYNSKLIVVDTLKPELVLKNVTINEGEKYNSRDFVTSCIDNSNTECKISFYEDAIDENGNKINYSSFKDGGEHNIKISAKDESGNEVVKDATLTINRKSNSKPTTPTVETCKYGNGDYDTNKYVLAVSTVANNCAISLDLYKNNIMIDKINKLMETETIRVKKDTDVLNLNGRFALNRQITAVFNNDGNGLVGYELSMSVNITNNSESRNIVSYKVNLDGKRVFSNNPYNLAN